MPFLFLNDLPNSIFNHYYYPLLNTPNLMTRTGGRAGEGIRIHTFYYIHFSMFESFSLNIFTGKKKPTNKNIFLLRIDVCFFHVGHFQIPQLDMIIFFHSPNLEIFSVFGS